MIINKSTFLVKDMDCPSEEQMIRMKLEHLSQVKYLEFDIPSRKLEVFHQDEVRPIHEAIAQLNLNDQLKDTIEAELPVGADDSRQRKILWWVLGINFGFFLIEMATGLISRSMGLIADSLDMLADSIVYALSLFAVGATLTRKKKVARISGHFQGPSSFLVNPVVANYDFAQALTTKNTKSDSRRTTTRYSKTTYYFLSNR